MERRRKKREKIAGIWGDVRRKILWVRKKRKEIVRNQEGGGEGTKIGRSIRKKRKEIVRI